MTFVAVEDTDQNWQRLAIQRATSGFSRSPWVLVSPGSKLSSKWHLVVKVQVSATGTGPVKIPF